MTRFFPLLLILLPLPAFALPEPEIREKVKEALKDMHPSYSRDWWRALGSDASRVMILMYRESGMTHEKLRLLRGLANFPEDASAVEFLKEQAEKTSNEAIRNGAIRDLGISQGAKEAAFIARFLKHADPNTRFAAAETLKKADDPLANELLEKHLAEEKTPWIADKLSQVEAKPVAKKVATDRVNPEVSGQWLGTWVASAGKKPGMANVETSAKLMASSGQVRGELTLKNSRTWKIVNAAGKGDTFSGELHHDKSPISRFEAQILPLPQGFLIQFWVPDQAGFFILRKR